MAGRFMNTNILPEILGNTRSTLGNLLLLSYLGYLGGHALERNALADRALVGVFIFGLIWFAFVAVSWARNFNEVFGRGW